MAPKRILYTSRDHKAADALDAKLLCHALRSALVRYERLAFESGYDLAFINNVTEADYALLNRVEIGLTETELRRTK